jgi:predicted amidohydrolase YtcJ
MTPTWKPLASGVLAALAGATMLVGAQQPAADLILSNGKIITVDEKFSIAQAVAVRGDRIVAVGSNQDVNRLAGPGTRRIDLRGRPVTPGFIDNHAHFMEEGAYWTNEHRLDGVDTRRQAIEMMRNRARVLGPDKWVFTLGGWSPDQFSDDKRPFTRAELDQVSTTNPILLQFTRCCTYLNSKAIEMLGLEKMNERWMERDANGRLTGVFDAAGAGRLSGHLTKVPLDSLEASSTVMLRDLNAAGLTASGGGCQFRDLYRRWANEGKGKMRFFCLKTSGTPGTPEQVDKVLPEIPKLRLFTGDEWIDDVYWGERVYNVNDNMSDAVPSSKPADFVQWGRVARELAKNGIPILIHTTLEPTVEQQLQQVEAINKEYPIRHLRWAFMHMEQVTPGQIERMRKLGMSIGVHPRQIVQGGLFQRAHGERSYHEPPLKTIQDSGIQWGFGTDAFEVNQYRPFTVLWWAVTGKMVGGTIVNREPINREDALAAYTRKNAYFLFRENDLGSIQPGKLADLVVIDKDYLTVPADQIKDIKSVMTIVGGRVVYEGEGTTATR